MRELPAGLAASLASGATTLCRCFIVTRTDGVKLGFTDHDEAVTIEGVTCSAESGFLATAVEQTLGLAVDGAEAFGALRDDRLEEGDLARGLYDNAAVELWLVDWTTPADRVLLTAGSIGEVARGRTAFQAELRSLAHALNQPRGRLYQRACDADVGDARCGIDLTAAAYRGLGTVTAVASARAFTASGLSAFAGDWFARGRLTWTSGANDGAAIEVRSQLRAGTSASLELWEEMPLAIAAGDTFTVTVGCDKAFGTCRKKFDNAVNFRGFPHMPGNDFAASVARQDDHNDGGRRG